AAALAGAAALGSPLFVKPANAGSSVGVARVAKPAELERAVRAALAFDRKVLLERAVDAREIECAVLGNDEPEASIPGEILVHHPDGFYSYDAKYAAADAAGGRPPAVLSLAQRQVSRRGRRQVEDPRRHPPRRRAPRPLAGGRDLSRPRALRD